MDDVSVTSCSTTADTAEPSRHPELVLVEKSSNWSVPSFGGGRSNSASASTSSSGSASSSSSSSTRSESGSLFLESDHPLLGMILVTISALLHTTLNMSVKTMMHETAWQELMFVRMELTWMLPAIWICVQFRGRLGLCGPSDPKLRWLLLLRGMFLWGSMFTCWWSFEYIPVGTLNVYYTISTNSEFGLKILKWISGRDDSGHELSSLGLSVCSLCVAEGACTENGPFWMDLRSRWVGRYGRPLCRDDDTLTLNC